MLAALLMTQGVGVLTCWAELLTHGGLKPRRLKLALGMHCLKTKQQHSHWW